MATVIPYEGRIRSLEDLTTVWNGNDNLQFVLHTGDPLTVESTYEEITQPTFPGYATSGVAIGSVALSEATHKAYAALAPVEFIHTGGGAAQTATAWAIVDTDTETILVYENLAPSKTFSINGDSITINATVTLTQG